MFYSVLFFYLQHIIEYRSCIGKENMSSCFIATSSFTHIVFRFYDYRLSISITTFIILFSDFPNIFRKIKWHFRCVINHHSGTIDVLNKKYIYMHILVYRYESKSSWNCIANLWKQYLCMFKKHFYSSSVKE